MVKPLSTQLAELADRAKDAEKAAAEAQKKAHGQIIALRDQARGAVQAAFEKVDTDIKSAGEDLGSAWSALKAKVAADKDAWNATVARFQHEVSAEHADARADMLEEEAAFAIDYAVAATEQAKMAVLDAISARTKAEEAKSGRP
ncbi:MAG: hypothetical protein ACR650_17380 [Methylocystis sp.]